MPEWLGSRKRKKKKIGQYFYSKEKTEKKESKVTKNWRKAFKEFSGV